MSEKNQPPLSPIFFQNQESFRTWLEENHQTKKEVLVGFHKVESRKPSLTWPESVAEALCFGWIDGVRRSVDKESYCIRFTPRNPKSNWSAVNIKKVQELKQLGLMKPAGLALYEKREEKKLRVYSYENQPTDLNEAFESIFRKNKQAWAYFQAQAPSYRKITARWVMSAKQEATRESRLKRLISDSFAGRFIKEMSYGKKKI